MAGYVLNQHNLFTTGTWGTSRVISPGSSWGGICLA